MGYPVCDPRLSCLLYLASMYKAQALPRTCMLARTCTRMMHLFGVASDLVLVEGRDDGNRHNRCDVLQHANTTHSLIRAATTPECTDMQARTARMHVVGKHAAMAVAGVSTCNTINPRMICPCMVSISPRFLSAPRTWRHISSFQPMNLQWREQKERGE